jgi:hypothetical protein
MAKKRKRPQSEIDAPDVPEPVYLVQHAGLNRKERRKLRMGKTGSINQVYRRTAD